VKFLNDRVVKSKLAKARKLVDVDVKDYCAVYYVGGHGPIMDLGSDPVNARLASQVGVSWLTA
jgi:putative intracellular protease/amidase